MDEELHQLCKEVYELTEWECGGEYVYHHNDLVNIVQGKPAGDYWENNWWFPLYTSDYLLEKLQEKYDIVLSNDERMWRAMNKRAQTLCEADTPLKALLKLVLALKEAGVKL